ncbi:MAG: hypothetical protein AAGJ94_01330 [Pseudomonadota bacterium]
MHIGPPKTGTTSIQSSLSQSRGLLADEGFFYPDRAKNHAFLLAPFHDHPKRQHILQRELAKAGGDEDALAIDVKRYVRNEVFSHHNANIIFSSEHLTLLNHQGVRRLRVFLHRNRENVKIIIYIRHPVEQAGSLIQEQVKNGARRLSDYADNPPFIHYRALIEKWADIFGADNMILRPYNKKVWPKGDLIADFFTVVGLGHIEHKVPREHANRGLSAAAVLLADALNGVHPQGATARAKPQFLKDIEGVKYVPDADILDAVRRSAEPHLVYLKEVWGLTLPEPKVTTVAQNPFDEAALRSIALQLNDLSVDKKPRRP